MKALTVLPHLNITHSGLTSIFPFQGFRFVVRMPLHVPVRVHCQLTSTHVLSSPFQISEAVTAHSLLSWVLQLFCVVQMT